MRNLARPFSYATALSPDALVAMRELHLCLMDRLHDPASRQRGAGMA